ncbi:TPA: hypothetical protein TXN53_002284 [Streptococcus suis]|nr:hypothetical protein [Streptococcus suis]
MRIVDEEMTAEFSNKLKSIEIDFLEMFSKGFQSDYQYLYESNFGARLSLLLSSIHEDLALLKSNKAGILIEDYYSLYANSIVSYYNSEHIFDEEYTIQEKFEEIPVEFFGQKANYKFIKSDNDVFIQLSDIVVSMLRMWMTMLERYSLDELQQLYFTLSNDKKDMMRSIQHLMMNSMSETYGFKHGIGSDRFEKKISHFLEFNF